MLNCHGLRAPSPGATASVVDALLRSSCVVLVHAADPAGLATQLQFVFGVHVLSFICRSRRAVWQRLCEHWKYLAGVWVVGLH